MKKYFIPFLLICFFSGLAWFIFPIHLSQYHDWGDDYAQYIQQALNISEGQDIGKTSYIKNPNFEIIGPTVYPNGLPVLMSISHLFNGNEIIGFLGLIAVFYILYSILSFAYFKTNLQNLAYSLVATLFLFTLPGLLGFKAEIISDIPFAVFFLASIIQFTKALKKTSLNWIALIIAGALGAYAIFTRSIGWTLVLGAILYFISNRTLYNQWKKLLIYIGSTLAFFLLLTTVFPVPSGSGYLSLLQEGPSLIENIEMNTGKYGLILRDIFGIYNSDALSISTVLSTGIFILFLLGFYLDFKKKRSFVFFVTLIYFMVGFIYPASMYARFFLPILPIMLLYAIDGLRLLSQPLPELKKIGFVFMVVAISINTMHLSRVRSNAPIKAGAQTNASLNMFGFLKSKCKEEEGVNFIKPRALALYTGLKTFCNNPEGNTVDFESQWNAYNIQWLVQDEKLSNYALDKYISENPQAIEIEYNKENFKIYRRLN